MASQYSTERSFGLACVLMRVRAVTPAWDFRVPGLPAVEAYLVHITRDTCFIVKILNRDYSSFRKQLD